ncbi:exported hypothetical protein [Agrobacterium genomosp. 2 str. CFBP 5494]|uniref:Secreted protein n=2 Tax=Rhizobiaceae TaxID=82115 RepID=A0A9W5AZS9_9HYPH|nr:hypothetical protein RP007_04429 [Rhizobium sp. P007]CUW88598.1 exported hypothetical protein [Agrobacterium genomosp. 2 str. CFBP 5494]
MRHIWLAASIASVAAVPAHASWEYAEWGMSPEQVVQASKGAAKKPSKADEYDDPDISHLLSAPARIGKAKGTAKFNFSAAGTLDTVRIAFPDPKTCSAVRKTLTAEYGKPRASEGSGGNYYVWAKTKEGNRIVLSSYPEIWCFAQFSAPGYRPQEKKQQTEKAVSNTVDTLMGEFNAGQKSAIKAFCADQWPTDFVMQRHCIDENSKAREIAQQFDVMKSKDHAVIWAQCLSQWKDKADGMDWVMMAHCLKEQEAALQAIRN